MNQKELCLQKAAGESYYQFGSSLVHAYRMKRRKKILRQKLGLVIDKLLCGRGGTSKDRKTRSKSFTNSSNGVEILGVRKHF